MSDYNIQKESTLHLVLRLREKFSVTYNMENITSDGEVSITNGSDYTAILTPSEECKLPEIITVKVGDTILNANTQYKYDATTGELVIYAENNVTGNLLLRQLAIK